MFSLFQGFIGSLENPGMKRLVVRTAQELPVSCCGGCRLLSVRHSSLDGAKATPPSVLCVSPNP